MSPSYFGLISQLHRRRKQGNLGCATDVRGTGTPIVDAHFRTDMPSGKTTILPGTTSYTPGRGETECTKCTKNRIQQNIGQVTKEQQTRIKMRESRIAGTKSPDLYFRRRTNRGQTLRVDCWSRKNPQEWVNMKSGKWQPCIWMRRYRSSEEQERYQRRTLRG